MKILNIAKNEINFPFYYDIHRLAGILKIGELPKIDDIVKKLKSKGFKASRTSLDYTGIKTNASFKELKRIL